MDELEKHILNGREEMDLHDPPRRPLEPHREESAS